MAHSVASLQHVGAQSLHMGGLQSTSPCDRSLSFAASASPSSASLRRLLPSAASNAPGQQQASRLVVEAKGRRGNMPYGRRPQQAIPEPTFDPSDDTPRFVLYIKSKVVNRWYPLSIVTGGTAAKMMLAVMRNEIGRKLYGSTLTRNIASVVYKDEKALRVAALKQYPILKGASAFEYGYSIMDRENPRASMTGSDVTKIPPAEELKTVLDKAKDFVDDKFGSIKESFGRISSLASPTAAASDAPSAQEAEKSSSK